MRSIGEDIGKSEAGGNEMRKIKFHLNTGYAGCLHEDILEFEDDITEEQIEYELEQWANDQIDAWWEEIEE